MRAAASAAPPPKNAATAGAAATAMPPRPMHSSTAESPMSSAASSAAKPSRRSASWTGAAGAVNQRPGSPASCSPISVPLRDMSVTSVEPVAPAGGERRALRRRHDQVEEEEVVAVERSAATSSPPSAAKAGSSRRQQQVRRRLAAHVQLVAHLEPLRGEVEDVDRARALEQRARAAGRARSRRKRARSTASSSPTPNQNVRPGPSLSVENARTPERLVLARPTPAIEGEQTPVIGPTWPCSLPLRSRTSPAAEQRRRRLAVAGPALEQARADAARGAADRRRRSHSIGGPGVQQHAVVEPVDHLAGRRDGHDMRPRALDAPPARPRWPASTRSPCAPQARSSSATHRGVAAARRAPVDVDRLGPLRAHGVGERRQPDVDGAHALQHAGARVMPDLAHLAAAVRAAPGLTAKRDLRLLDGLPFAARRRRRGARRARRRRARRLRRGDRARAARPPTRSPPAPPRSRPTSPTCAPWAAARSRSSTRSSAPTATTPERVLDGLAWAADRLGVPVVGGHLTLGAPGGAVGLLHRRGDHAAARAPPRRPGDVLLAAFCLEGSRSRPRSADLHLAARPRPGAAARGRRGARRGRRGAASATPRATSRCPASPARCCSCSSSPAAARRSTSTASRAPTGVALERWLLTFPSFGFVLAAAPEHVDGGVRRRSRAATWPARRAAPSTTRACCAWPAAGSRRRCGTWPPSRSRVRRAERDRHGLVRAAVEGDRGAVAPPPERLEEGHVGQLDHGHHPLRPRARPPWRPRSARAGRRARRGGPRAARPAGRPSSRRRASG